jgi:hypothetical protein
MSLPGVWAGPWEGADFAFCFVTDDGKLSNLAWADTARAMDFRFTIAVNLDEGDPSPNELSAEQMHELWEDGFEIAQHGRTHADAGLPLTCPSPPRGSLMGYFMCDEADEQVRMEALTEEISRETLADLSGIPASDIRVVAYPRHRHGKALIDSLQAEGYIGARTGGYYDYDYNSYGDFLTPASNSWEGGISLFRVPNREADSYLFGNHSADPPVHFDYATFRERADQVIAPFQQSGGICVIYTHHLGDDDDSLGDINYGSGGITSRDLAWLVDYVREHNGRIMTFGEAVAYYRARSHKVDVDGDAVWMPGAAAGTPAAPEAVSVGAPYPNPFNGGTRIAYELTSDVAVRIDVHDLRGRRVVTLVDGKPGIGSHEAFWSGRDAQGRTVGAGAYLVRVACGDAVTTRRVSLLK